MRQGKKLIVLEDRSPGRRDQRVADSEVGVESGDYSVCNIPCEAGICAMPVFCIIPRAPAFPPMPGPGPPP